MGADAADDNSIADVDVLRAMPSLRQLFVVALAWRTFNALMLRTAFSPDEYWQSLEVAHRLVFGYGHLTWDWGAGIRSYLHPLAFAAPLQVLKLFRADSTAAVVRAPQLLQALFAAVTDIHVFLLTRQLMGQAVAKWALLCQLLSWFNAYCLVRTYSNSLEATCAVVALHHWFLSRKGQNFDGAQPSGCRARSGSGRGGSGHIGADAESAGGAAARHLAAALAAASLGVVLRPPSLLFWLPVGAWEVSQHGRRRGMFLRQATLIGTLAVVLSCIVDRLCYGRWLFAPWEFAKFNLLRGSSAQYGAHPWHWNFSQGFLTVAATLLPLGLLGVRWSDKRELAGLAAWSLAVYSLPAHKEFRFLLPALQLFVPYCGVALAHAFRPDAAGASKAEQPAEQTADADAERRAPTATKAAAESATAELQPALRRLGGRAAAADPASTASAAGAGQQELLQRPSSEQQRSRANERRLWRLLAALLLLLQIPAAAFFGLIHQRGTVAVVQHLAAAVADSSSILFLTPCHATPLYSHIHRRIPARFLDCSPPGWAPVVACLNPAGQMSTLPSSEAVCTTCRPTGRLWSLARPLQARHRQERSPDSAPKPAFLRHVQAPQQAAGGCHALFNASAAADAAFCSEWQKFEAAPAAWLNEQYPLGSRTKDVGFKGGSGRISRKAGPPERSLQATAGGRDGRDGGNGDASGALGLPTHVVLFERLLPTIAPWSSARGFVPTHRFPHQAFGVDGEREAAVLVLRRPLL